MTRPNGNEVVDPLSLLEQLQNYAYQKGYNQALLEKLLEAKGEMISTEELLEFYGGKDALKPAIYLIRKVLKEKMPEIQIISTGQGYLVAINSCPQ